MAAPRKTAPKKAAPKTMVAGEQPPAQVEAESADFLALRYTDEAGSSFDFTIPADPDEWPSTFHMGAALNDKNARLWAIRSLVGDAQWMAFCLKFPARKHALKLADLAAESAGLGNAKN